MIKFWLIIGVVGISGLILFFIYREGQERGQAIEIVKKQEIQIEKKNQEIRKVYEVIETKKNQQKIINESYSDIAARVEWMRLIFEERRASSETN